MSSQQWKSLLHADGGHGMPPGDDVGAQWTVTLIEMTDAAFAALPEFQGH